MILVAVRRRQMFPLGQRDMAEFPRQPAGEREPFGIGDAVHPDRPGAEDSPPSRQRSPSAAPVDSTTSGRSRRRMPNVSTRPAAKRRGWVWL